MIVTKATTQVNPPGEANGRDVKPLTERFNVVSVTWALSSLVTSASFPEPIFAPLIVLASLLLLIWPSSVQLMLVLTTLVFSRIFYYLPGGPNHYIFEMLCCLSFVTAGIYLLSKRSLTREGLLETAGPTVRMVTLIVYFYAVIDKINWDYLSSHGCGWYLISPFFGGPDIANHLPILWKLGVYGSLAMEGFIFLGLAIPRWRATTLIVGAAFHTMLALVPHAGIASFSGLVLSVYTLFLPNSIDWQKWSIPHLSFDWRKRALIVLGGVLTWSAISLVLAKVVAHATLKSLAAQNIAQSEGYARSILLTVFLFAPMGFWMIWNLIRTLPTRSEPAIRLPMMRPAFMSFILVFAILNGLCPFLGLKTHTSFSMFSNLATEKGLWNHVFIPKSVQVFHYQDEWITVTKAPKSFNFATNIPDMVPVEFKKRFARIKDGDVVEFTRNGRPGRLVKGQPAGQDADLTEPLNVFEAKFLRFRPLVRGDQFCRQ